MAAAGRHTAARTRLASAIWLIGLVGATVMALGWIEVFSQIPDEWVGTRIEQVAIGADYRLIPAH